ncbi:MAG: TetR/AcrR family transcriptional regulator [Lachnospiraceae bacterium]|nr:TetR/AcrR family transcriptional regulator [Lachnospiraceae bacterium]
MPRKQVITKELLLEGAFELVKEQGKEELSARHLAAKCGCSTQPIFRLYKNMKDLEKDLLDKCAEFFSSFYKNSKPVNETPFVDLGLAYIRFASVYPKLFRVVFLDESEGGKSMYDLINGGENNFVINEFRKMKGVSQDDFSLLFMKMWIFIHGIACMVLKDDFDMTEKEIEELLCETYLSFADIKVDTLGEQA